MASGKGLTGRDEGLLLSFVQDLHQPCQFANACAVAQRNLTKQLAYGHFKHIGDALEALNGHAFVIASKVAGKRRLRDPSCDR